MLSAALENSADPLAACRVLRRLKHESKIRELDLAKKIAAYRSGARGLKARKEERALENELIAVTAAYVFRLTYIFLSLATDNILIRLDLGDNEIEETTIAAETHEAVEMLNELEASLDAV